MSKPIPPETTARIVRLMLEEPTLTDLAIRERFGIGGKTVSDLRKLHGAQRVRHVMGVRRGKR